MKPYYTKIPLIMNTHWSFHDLQQPAKLYYQAYLLPPHLISQQTHQRQQTESYFLQIQSLFSFYLCNDRRNIIIIMKIVTHCDTHYSQLQGTALESKKLTLVLVLLYSLLNFYFYLQNPNWKIHHLQ